MLHSLSIISSISSRKANKENNKSPNLRPNIICHLRLPAASGNMRPKPVPDRFTFWLLVVVQFSFHKFNPFCSSVVIVVVVVAIAIVWTSGSAYVWQFHDWFLSPTEPSHTTVARGVGETIFPYGSYCFSSGRRARFRNGTHFTSTLSSQWGRKLTHNFRENYRQWPRPAEPVQPPFRYLQANPTANIRQLCRFPHYPGPAW